MISLAAAVTGAGLALAWLDRAPIEVRETRGLTYVAYRGAAVNDAVAHRGTLGVDSAGCVYFDLGPPEPAVRYRPAFPDGTAIMPDGVRTLSGRFQAFGEEVVVGREYDPYFDALDPGPLSKCDADLDVFGMGFS